MIAKQANFSPVNNYLAYLSYNYLSANLRMGGTPIPVPPNNPHIKPPLPTLDNSSYIINSWKVSNFSISTPQYLLCSLNPSANGLPTIILKIPYLAAFYIASLGKLYDSSH